MIRLRDLQVQEIAGWLRANKCDENIVLKFISEHTGSRSQKWSAEERVKEFTYEETWITRSGKVGDYAAYLKSDEWQAVRRKSLTRKRNHFCRICGRKMDDLHHVSYRSIGTVHELYDIIPLCRMHHEMIHAYAKGQNVSVRIATNKIAAIYKSQKGK